jgi:cysteine-rich repeat protein
MKRMNIFCYKGKAGVIFYSLMFAVTMVHVAMAHTITLETENMNNIVAPMQVGSDGSTGLTTNGYASGGKFIYVPAGSGASYSVPGKGMASYIINVPQGGAYALWGRVSAVYPKDDFLYIDDSFFVQADNGTNYTWKVTGGSAWHWVRVKDYFQGNITFNLSAGMHTIKVKQRRDGTKIDRLVLTNDLSFIPSDIKAVCGNGAIEPGEECDDRNMVSADGCSSACVIEKTQTPLDVAQPATVDIRPVCGNGAIESGEECDDGNIVNGDGCSQACKKGVCGDSTVQTGLGEQCEGTSIQSCVTSAGYKGTQSCDTACHWGSCASTEYCGDGVVQSVEECDDGNTINGDGCSSCIIKKTQTLLDKEGLTRVKLLEDKLNNMTIIPTHPRLFLNNEKLSDLRAKKGQAAWNAILAQADKGDMISSALGYLMVEETDPVRAHGYAQNVFNSINTATYTNWCSTGLYDHTSRIKISMASLAFDWVYNGLTEAERNMLIQKLAMASDMAAKKSEIDNGIVPKTSPSACYQRGTKGETFHREEWAFYAYEAWPEIALAGHHPDAAAVYKARWDYRWYWGDAARMEAYVNDGSPFEGYYFGNEGVSWFLPLESATGINLVDGPDFGWNRDAAYYLLYRFDIANSRETMHKGVAYSTSVNSFLKSSPYTWKLREYISRTFSPWAKQDPYLQWIIKNKIDRFSSWLMTNNYFYSVSDLYQISKLLFYDEAAPQKDPATAAYTELKFDRHFDGGNEVYMRTGWGPKSTIVGFRSKPVFTMTSHSDFDVNTFVIYRDGGPLSVDSGTYDAYQQQRNYLQYQKNTVAHNNLLIVDPKDPDGPKKLALTTDPGGVDLRSTRTFSAPNQFSNSVFVENVPTANWADIIHFESHKDYAYVTGDAREAYGSRLSQYDRNLAFLRLDNDEAYLIIFDRVSAADAAFKKKWLLHTVTEPVVTGSIVNTEVPGHIETYDGDYMSAENYEKTSKLHAKFLLPLNRHIRRISGEIWHTDGAVSIANGSDQVVGAGTKFTPVMTGHYFHVNKDKTSIVPKGYDGYYDWFQIKSVEDETHMTLTAKYIHAPAVQEAYTINQGYQFLVDGTKPKNVFVTGATKADATDATGRAWQHMGQGRIELMPPDGNKTDYFLVAMYLSDINAPVPQNVSLIENLSGDAMSGVIIDNKVVMFGKMRNAVHGTQFKVAHNGVVDFLITDLVPGQIYRLQKDNSTFSTQTASQQGTIYFSDDPGVGGALYSIQP